MSSEHQLAYLIGSDVAYQQCLDLVAMAASEMPENVAIKMLEAINEKLNTVRNAININAAISPYLKDDPSASARQTA